METVMPVDSFPIDRLQGAPPCRKTLTGMNGRCSRMPECEKLCRRLLERLQFLHDSVKGLEDKDRRKKIFIDVVVAFVKLMRRTALLVRLATSETIVVRIRGMQEKLNEIQREVGLGDAPEMTEWSNKWDEDQAQQLEKLQASVPKASARMLINEVGGGEKKLKETLMTLQSGMSWPRLSPEMLKLKEETYNRVFVYWGHKELRTFDWFIPKESVAFNDDDYIGEGTFGKVSRAIWAHNDKQESVVVKELFPENNDDSETGFFRQLQTWSSITEDTHILKLHGGSHVSSPQFYVCEDAHFGTLDAFLAKHPTMFWRMFYQVAQGLRALHTQSSPIVHNGLKCSNILVGEGFTAKLADFGFSSVRTLSATVSGQRASQRAIRWKAKELLQEAGNEEPLFASDIYAVGMCMIEAITGRPPYGVEGEDTEMEFMTDDDEIMDKILNGELPDHPDCVSDDTWDVITRLCDEEPTNRPTLDQMLEDFGSRAANETEEERKLSQTQSPVPFEAAMEMLGGINSGASSTPLSPSA